MQALSVQLEQPEVVQYDKNIPEKNGNTESKASFSDALEKAAGDITEETAVAENGAGTAAALPDGERAELFSFAADSGTADTAAADIETVSVPADGTETAAVSAVPFLFEDDTAGIDGSGKAAAAETVPGTETAVAAAKAAENGAAALEDSLPEDQVSGKEKKTETRKQAVVSAADENSASAVSAAFVLPAAQRGAAADAQPSAADAKTEKTGKTRKNTDRPLIEVRDERSVVQPLPQTEQGVPVPGSVTFNADGSAEMFIGRGQGNGKAEFSAGKEDGGQSHFSTMLSSELQKNADEFVRAGTIVLRDNNSGTIRLTLRPEELGNVKINLELADKVITGKIVVASEEAYQAFRNSMDSLKEAFIAGGFENAGFELSWSGSGGSGSESGHSSENAGAPFYEAAVPLAVSEDSPAAEQYALSAVNIMA